MLLQRNQCAIGAWNNTISVSFPFFKALDYVFPDPLCTSEGVLKARLFAHLVQRCLSSFESMAIYKIKMNLILFIPPACIPDTCNWCSTSSLWISEQHPSLKAGQTQTLWNCRRNISPLKPVLSTGISTVASGSDSRFLFLTKLQPTHLSGLVGKYCGMWHGPQSFFSGNNPLWDSFLN